MLSYRLFCLGPAHIEDFIDGEALTNADIAAAARRELASR
jgi:hypothetical protein